MFNIFQIILQEFLINLFHHYVLSKMEHHLFKELILHLSKNAANDRVIISLCTFLGF